MHPHDSSRAPSFLSPTPIYDALYSEYLRSFRALPGDRSGEEDLGFPSFGTYGSGSGTGFSSVGTGFSSTGTALATGSSYATGSSVSGWNGSAWQTDPWQTAYPTPQPQPQPLYAAATASTGTGTGLGATTTGMYASGRQHQTGMHHIPAALPPAPRRGY
ncbi:hypothetical protein [Streptomyces bambusae]|uniref:Uncharacterized protein n=1 Tax=Streptomyces bambusae TaxID=1550616 RepID=A0ABS6ZFC8_9ACTN|nr:hypothetical protein [Streptomyces bambusae]MBW5486467.1 hypothetical protein [Streptomyces bambusae]